LTEQFGKGHWSHATTEKGVRLDMKTGTVWVLRRRGKIVATVRLSTRKPWAIDASYFSPCKKPIYLTAMAVDPRLQRNGLGRLCVHEAKRIAREWAADAIRLDVYDAPAGAGRFYAKSGFEAVGRATYRATPLVYLQAMLLPASAATP